MDTLKNESTLAPLSEIITDFVEDNLSSVEKNLFQEYLAQNPVVSRFVEKSKQGKRILKTAYSVQAADDFEEKLAQRLVALKEEESA